MSNADPKPGGYADLDLVLFTEMNLVRTGIISSVDGVGGGTYTPAATIQIEGTEGVTIAGTGSAARLRYSSRTIERVMPDSAFRVSTNWAWDFDPAFYYWRDATGAGVMQCDLQGIPNACVLDSITLRWQGVAGALGGTAPFIRAYKMEVATGTSTAIFAQYDDPAYATGLAAYTAVHNFAKTSIAETINRKEYRYTLRIVASTGGGFTNDRLFGVTVGCTLTDQSEYDP